MLTSCSLNGVVGLGPPTWGLGSMFPAHDEDLPKLLMASEVMSGRTVYCILPKFWSHIVGLLRGGKPWTWKYWKDEGQRRGRRKERSIDSWHLPELSQ